MNKVLEKSLKDARKEDRLTMGSRQVLNSVKDSKLIILSRSVDGETSRRIESDAKEQEIPLVNFQGTSVALGKLCGLQFRISTISFTSITNDSIKAILNDAQAGAKND
jgi:large subunit ribosomal protein L30e